MEVEPSSLFLLLSISVFIFMIHKLLARSTTKTPTLHLPPGPPKLPFIGNLHNLAGSNDPPHQTLKRLAMKYGPLMHLQLGEVPTVVVSSPATAKQLFKVHDINFASRPSLFATEVNCYNNTDIAFSPYGEYWRQLRKICTLELLSVKRVQSFRHIREEEMLKLCRWIAANAGSRINLTEKLSPTNYEIIVRASLGKKTDEEARFVSVVKETIEFLSGFHITDVYPSIKLFRHIGGFKAKLERLHRVTDSLLENIIAKRKQANAAKTDEGERDEEDLLDVLLKFQDELNLTTDNVKSVLGDLFGAGIEASTTVLDWAMAELMKNPRIMSKAQDEVRRVFDSKQHVDESKFNELEYLKLVIKETLRIHPPAPLLLPRESSEHCQINGYDVPAKTRVLVNAWAMGRDPEYWDDAESFVPERFLGKSVDYKGNYFEYIPFGAGRRICPGISFGLANVELPLAMFLYHFDWILPEGMKVEEMNMAEASGVAARRLESLCVTPVVRRPLLVKCRQP